MLRSLTPTSEYLKNLSVFRLIDGATTLSTSILSTHRFPQSILAMIFNFSSLVWSCVKVPETNCLRHSNKSRITFPTVSNL